MGSISFLWSLVGAIGMAANAQAATDDVVYLKQPIFKIPIEVAPDNLSKIKELRLYVSTDTGQTWSLVKTADPSQKMFLFRAQADGEYWFKLGYVNQAGDFEPRDLRREPPDVRVVLDTKLPYIELKAQPREPNKIGVVWKARDEKLDLSSFKLEMKSERDSTWQEVPASKMREGETSWPAAGQDSYSVRATIRDRAGNESIAQVEIPRIAGENGPSLARTSEPPRSLNKLDLDEGNFAVPPAPTFGEGGSRALTSGTSIPRASARSAPPMANPSPAPLDPAFAPPAAPYTVAAASLPPSATAPASSPRFHEVQRPAFDRSRPDLPADRGTVSPIQPVSASPAMAEASRGQAIATTQSVDPAGRDARNQPQPSGRQPWLVGSRQFAVDYELRHVGPAGVKRVEMYMTKDNGKNWKLLAEDPDKLPPFDVELPEEGRFGLKVVVVSPAGWQQPPKPGEAPRIVVQVDTTPPEAELYQMVPDPAANTDALLVRWSAKDAHLAPNPVSLYFAERPEGPWWAIATGLPAVGQYSWRVPQGVPPEVYVRLEARDLAGNASRATTKEAQSVDLSRPEAEVIAILPSGGLTR